MSEENIIPVWATDYTAADGNYLVSPLESLAIKMALSGTNAAIVERISDEKTAYISTYKLNETQTVIENRALVLDLSQPGKQKGLLDELLNDYVLLATPQNAEMLRQTNPVYVAGVKYRFG